MKPPCWYAPQGTCHDSRSPHAQQPCPPEGCRLHDPEDRHVNLLPPGVEFVHDHDDRPRDHHGAGSEIP